LNIIIGSAVVIHSQYCCLCQCVCVCVCVCQHWRQKYTNHNQHKF